jgi:hypothetical protein
VTFPIIGIEFHALKQNRTSMFGTTLETDLGQILVTFLRDRLYLRPDGLMRAGVIGGGAPHGIDVGLGFFGAFSALGAAQDVLLQCGQIGFSGHHAEIVAFKVMVRKVIPVHTLC